MSCTDTAMLRVLIDAKNMARRLGGVVNAKQLAFTRNMTTASARKLLDELAVQGYMTRIVGGDRRNSVRYRPDFTKTYEPKRRLRRHDELLKQDASVTESTDILG